MAGIEKKELRKFGLVLTCIMLGIAGMNAWKGHYYAAGCFTGILCITGVFSAFRPGSLGLLYFILERIGKFIGKINTFLILFLVFYIIITPIGVIMRLLKKDPIEKHIDPGMESYWIKRERNITVKEQMEKQF